MECILRKIFRLYELLFKVEDTKTLCDAECDRGTLVDKNINHETDEESNEEQEKTHSECYGTQKYCQKQKHVQILTSGTDKSNSGEFKGCNDFDSIKPLASKVDSSAEFSNATCVDGFEDLLSQCPAEVAFKILGYLSCYDLVHRVSLVSKTWHSMAFNPSLWGALHLRPYVINDVVVHKLVQLCKFIRFMEIMDAKTDDLTDDGLVALATGCPNLKIFYAPRSGSKLTDDGFVAFAEHCPQLKALTLDCLDITDRTLTSISSNLHELEYLSICQISPITNEGVAEVIRGCRKLEKLYCNINHQINEKCLRSIPESSRSLKWLEFMMCRLDPTGVPILGELKNLKLLNLSQCVKLETEHITPVVRGCRNLTTLNLNLNEKIDDKSIEVIFEYLHELKRIYLVSTSITDAGLDVMANRGKELVDIDVGYTKVTCDGAREVSEFCPQLRQLGLMRCDLVLESIVEELAVQYPNITYSTFKQDAIRYIRAINDKKLKETCS